MNQEKENRIDCDSEEFPKEKIGRKKTLKALLELQASWLRVAKALKLLRNCFLINHVAMQTGSVLPVPLPICMRQSDQGNTTCVIE